MDIEQVLPQVLERVDLRPVGPRGVAMLELLYLRQGGRPNPVILGCKEISRLTGRSLDQAKYDTKALERLRALGMVRRCPGRGRMARAWSLNELRYWRVRWLGRRDQIIAYFAGLEQGDLISLWGDHAGQRPRLRGDDPRNSPGLWGGLSVADRPATESDRPATELAERESDGSPPHKVDAGGGHVTVPLLTSKEVREKQIEEEERAHIKVLARAVAKRIPDREIRSLQGRALRPIEEVIDKFGDHWNYLYNLAETFTTKTVSPPVAAEEFLDLVEERAAQGWPPIRAWSPSGSQPFSEPEADDGPPMSDTTRQKMREAIRDLREQLA